MSDVFIRAARLARTLATLRESYTISLASQETFVTIIDAMTTLSSLLQWHVHLSPPPGITCVQAHNGGRPVCNRALTVFLTL